MTGVEEMATMKAKCRILLSCDVARAAARRRFMMILGYVIGGSWTQRIRGRFRCHQYINLPAFSLQQGATFEPTTF
jgi:hypothetical protein